MAPRGDAEPEAEVAAHEHGSQMGQSTPTDVVEAALALALTKAAAAGRFDVVAQLAKELEARRTAASNVVSISARRAPK